MAIQNRYEFMYYVACTNCNPNGDPDMGNMPRLDPQTMQGFITDAATKRRIRNYVELAHQGEPGMNIIIQQATNINRIIAEVREAAGVPVAIRKDKDPAKKPEFIQKARAKACSMFYDVRAFGAVMSTGPNAGQVRGPVQITFGKSLDAVLPLDISITRMATAEDVKNGEQSVENYKKMEETSSGDALRTMGRKQIIPFGLYEVRGFVSANLAEETGFDDEDLNVLFESILNMYEHDHSASKGEMAVVSPLIISGTLARIPTRRRESVRPNWAAPRPTSSLIWSRSRKKLPFPIPEAIGIMTRLSLWTGFPRACRSGSSQAPLSR